MAAQLKQRRSEFKKLLVYISDRLDQDAVTQIEFLCDLSVQEDGSKRSRLDVLTALDKQGHFSSTNTQPLVKLLGDINQHQIAEYVKTNYQTSYPDVAHKPVSRTESLPPKASPKLTGGRDKRSNTLTGISITLSPPDCEEESLLLKLQETSNGSKSASLEDINMDGCKVYPEQNVSRPNRGAFTTSVAEEVDSSLDSKPVQPFEVENGEIRPRANTEVDRSQSTKEEEMRVRSRSEGTRWPEGTPVNITVNVYPQSPARTKQFHRKKCAKPPHKSVSCPNEDVQSLKQLQTGQVVKHHPPLSTSQSAPGDMYDDTTLPNVQEINSNSDSNGGLTMSMVHGRELAPPPGSPGSLRQATSDDTRSQGSRFKNFSRKIRGQSTERVCLEKSTQHTWSITRQSLLQSIWNHGRLDCTKCSDPIPINIECGSLDPQLFLQLYPFGIFSDASRSMTLVIKVVIPDDCPPIPNDASFSMTWEIFKVDKHGVREKFECSKKPKDVKITTGMDYIHKFLQHDVLQKHKCEKVEMSVQLKTTYSVYHKFNTNTVNDIARYGAERIHPDEMLLSLKIAVGDMKLASAIGDAYLQFGQSLLDDVDGTVTQMIARDLKNNVVNINNEILARWMQGKGRKPVAWDTVIKVLREIDMHDLASRMENNLSKCTTTATSS